MCVCFFPPVYLTQISTKSEECFRHKCLLAPHDLGGREKGEGRGGEREGEGEE